MKDESLYDKSISDFFAMRFFNQIFGCIGELCLHLKISTQH